MIIIFVPVLLENADRIKMFLFSSHSIDEHWELFYSENYKPTENVGISFSFTITLFSLFNVLFQESLEKLFKKNY